MNLKKIGLAIGIICGVPIALIVVLFLWYVLDIPLRVGGDKLYEEQFIYKYEEKNLLIGDSIIGSGYIFPRCGRDIWMRVRTTANYVDDKFLPGSLTNCSPERFKIIHAWFLEQAASPKRLLWIVPLPLSKDARLDREILTDTANILCEDGGNMPLDIWSKNKFGDRPKGCYPDWILYHKPSGFYYRRSSCMHDSLIP